MPLSPSWTWGSVDLTAPPFLFAREADEFDPGAPVTATEALAQLLDDGEIEVSSRASNRTLAFTVYVDATDLLAQAQAEALLALEADKARNTLAFDPGDGVAPVTVFETFAAQLVVKRSDVGDMQIWRGYQITCSAAPFSRSKDLVVTTAPPSAITPTVVTINAADSMTGWSSPDTLTDQGSNLRVSPQPTQFTFTSGVSVSLSSTNIVSLVMWRYVSGAEAKLVNAPPLRINGDLATLVAGVPVSATRTRYYYQTLLTSGTVFRFGNSDAGYGTGAIEFTSLQRSDAVPSTGSTRQTNRSLLVAGSARTQGSLSLQHATSALGSTLIYTWPYSPTAQYVPPLRNRRSGGGSPTTDTSLISGARDLLDTAVTFGLAASTLTPGTHLLLARVRSNTNGDQTINWSARMLEAGTAVGPTISGSRVVSFDTTPTTWRIVVLGRLVLPTVGVPSTSTGIVEISIVAASPASSDIDLDEGWIFNTSIGDLTWVECGTATPSAGGSSNRLWLDSATLNTPRPMIYRGSAADRSDAFSPGSDVQSFGVHKLEPPLINVFTVTSNASDAALTLSQYPRWHTHAAQ